MAIFIYLFAIITNMLLGAKNFLSPLNRYSKKYSRILVLITFIIFFILIAGYRNNSGYSGDLTNNMYEYNSFARTDITIYESGFAGLIKIGVSLGLDFFAWRNLMVFASLVLIFVSVLKWSNNPHYVLSLYGVYLIIMSAEQLRNFVAFSLLQLAFGIYFYSGIKHKKLICAIIIFAAGSIHTIFFVYFLLLLADKSFSKRAMQLMSVCILGFCLLIFIRGNNIPGLNLIISMFSGNRLQVYFESKTRFGFIYSFALHLILVSLSSLIVKHTTDSSHNERVLINKFFVILMVVFPLYMINLTFLRLLRNVLVVSYMSQGNYISEYPPDKYKVRILMLSLLSVGIWFCVNLVILTPPKALLIPFFQDNFFFN